MCFEWWSHWDMFVRAYFTILPWSIAAAMGCAALVIRYQYRKAISWPYDCPPGSYAKKWRTIIGVSEMIFWVITFLLIADPAVANGMVHWQLSGGGLMDALATSYLSGVGVMAMEAAVISGVVCSIWYAVKFLRIRFTRIVS